MKKLFFLSLFVFIVGCNAQPRSDYEIYSNPVVNATKYHFFLEKKSAQAYKLVQGMDYLNPTVVSLKVGENTAPTFTINLLNDGSEYTVGVVAEDVTGFYSGMGVGVATIGKSPGIPGMTGLRKK